MKFRSFEAPTVCSSICEALAPPMVVRMRVREHSTKCSSESNSHEIGKAVVTRRNRREGEREVARVL